MSDYCQPAPDHESRRRETTFAMRYVHALLTPVVFGIALFGIGLAEAQDDKSAPPSEIYSERCGADRCEFVPSLSGERAEPEESTR